VTSTKPYTRRPTLRTLAVAAFVVAPLLTAGSAEAESYKPAVGPAGHGGHGNSHGRTVDSIQLPGGWAPEGITDDGRHTLYVGSLGPQRGSTFNGAIYAADVRTGRGRIAVPGAEGRVTVGITYDRGRIWAAGGATGVVRVHDARTGALLKSWTVPGAGFLNDLVVTPKGVYVTDSANPQLTVIPFGRHGRLPDEPTVLPVTGVTYAATGANLNGVVAYDGGRDLVAVQSNAGKLFRLDPRTAAATEIPVTGGPVHNGDGLEQARGKLYVVRNQNNLVAEVKLDRRLTGATVLRTLTDPQFDIPSTATYAAGFLWAVNARFTTNPVTPETTFTVERVDLR
jgi:hypothetical protein